MTTYLKFFPNQSFFNEDLSNNTIEIETFVDPINITDGHGKELTLNILVPSINNNKTFYTDANGLEM